MFYNKVDGIYFNERQHISVAEEISNKTYVATELQEHYVIVGEPYELYLAHVSLQNGKDLTIAEHIHKTNKDSELEKQLKFVGL